jgi:predicted GIY-YIG superfamily endonuclease/RNA-binding protein YhbY
MAKHNHEGKTWYVYELIDVMGTVTYVGCSYRPHYRFKQHTLCKKGRGVGYFHGRLDLTLNIVQGYSTRKEALRAEGALKLEYGMAWTERDQLRANGAKARDSGSLAEISRQNWKLNWREMTETMVKIGVKHRESGHIQQIGAQSMAREFQCEHCGVVGKGAVFFRWHGAKCKKNPVANA